MLKGLGALKDVETIRNISDVSNLEEPLNVTGLETFSLSYKVCSLEIVCVCVPARVDIHLVNYEFLNEDVLTISSIHYFGLVHLGGSDLQMIPLHYPDDASTLS